MNTIPTTSPIASSGMDLRNMDIETALLAVQTERVQLLDEQLMQQMEEVQARNEQIAKLAEVQTGINELLQHFGSDAKADKKLKDVYKGNLDTAIKDINEKLKAAGIDTTISGDTTKGQLETMLQETKNAVDKANNTQQMDMLRLQSLSSKRNEAFDVMTNFVKKMQDSRNSIIANMR